MIRVYTPATSANCCVGFDCLGLALDWYSAFTFEEADQFRISGCDEAFANADNLVWKTFVRTCEAAGKVPGPVHIHIDSEVPLARGLGSSSQCVAAGLIGARELYGLDLSMDDLMDIGCEIEGHPDNITPALLGGLCANVMEPEEVMGVQLEASGWKALAAIPPYEVSTPAARKVLPASIPLHDAASQVGRAILFTQAWQKRNESLLFAACKDNLHEPSRALLIEDYEDLRDIANQLELPFWISGSGSTMLFVSQSEERLARAARLIEGIGFEGELRLCAVSGKGSMIDHG